MTSDALWDRAIQLGASTLYEAGGGIGAVDPAIRPVWHGAMVSGRAYPVTCAVGDNLGVHRALELCRPGDVLVVNARGDSSGYFGEVLANAAKARGVRGVVMDGGVRDIDAFERMRFPVFARWISMRRTIKQDPGDIGQAIDVGGVRVTPTSVVVADSDGVFVCEGTTFAKTVQDAEARAAREATLISRIEAGELTLDLLKLRPASPTQ
jgi:4-hydroxy-4-methyl-2-oxoglutarate aldolase